MLPLVNVEIGALNQIAWGLSWSRLGFIRSLSDFIITPFPDRCFNRFFNDQGTDSAYFYKQIKDRLISFNKDMKIYVWDIVTGKLKNTYEMKGFEDIENFTRLIPRGMETTLFHSNAAVEDSSEKYEDFYDA